MMMRTLLKTYSLSETCRIEPLTSGLINKTWKVIDGEQQYILQQINNHVFKKPFDLATNIRLIDEYLKVRSPEYLFVSPLRNIHDQDLIHEKDDGYFRLFPFIKGSHTVNVVTTPEQSFEAAFQFGKFTQLLSQFDVKKLHITIPDFHNLTLRYNQFEKALETGNAKRIKESYALIGDIKDRKVIVEEFEKLQKHPDVRQRVMHHDTKISNVLFDEHGKGMCVIDLDTIMPGYFISDVGDMMRTYLSPANEEEKDFKGITVREDFFRAIVHGYLSTMKAELTPTERSLILYSGLFMIYMQALRFLTDYFNNDVYYGARYEDHNLIRAGNQIDLLKKMEEKKEILELIIAEELRVH